MSITPITLESPAWNITITGTDFEIIDPGIETIRLVTGQIPSEGEG